MNDKQKMIEKLKTTWTAFGGLNKDEQDFLREHREDVGVLASEGSLCCVGQCGSGSVGIVHRLRPDFELKKKRWFFNIDTLEVE
ncbi:MAG: hypothetical protein MIO92_07730, partial [Methanosarcinaceae archaeon]|nr:hypothetical protein [Methanosarcinaceae archaeon]